MATHGRRRALGQHFLKDVSICQTIVDKMLDEAVRNSCHHLLEIGPGHGALTLLLLKGLEFRKSLQSFQLVERDPQIATLWKNQKDSSPFPYQIELGDFLDIPEDKWLRKGPFAVISNLPYSAGTAILNRLARYPSEIPVMVLMFQQEVAQRLRAEPSTPDRGSLSIWIQNRWDVKKLMQVPPRAFTPPPDVQSEVVVLTRRDKPWIQVEPEMEPFWEKFLKTCFAHRRKMLRTSIPWRNALELSGVDGTRRAEALHWEEWDRLFQAVKKEQFG